MTWADTVNGVYEMGGALALAWNCWTTYKDKEIKGLSIVSMVFFTSWGYWNLYYYPSLNQWMSTIWLGQAVYYTYRGKDVIGRFWDKIFGTNEMIEDFEEHFPGKCLICSYHRYGFTNGMTEDPNPPPHENCPERTKL